RLPWRAIDLDQTPAGAALSNPIQRNTDNRHQRKCRHRRLVQPLKQRPLLRTLGRGMGCAHGSVLSLEGLERLRFEDYVVIDGSNPNGFTRPPLAPKGQAGVVLLAAGLSTPSGD